LLLVKEKILKLTDHHPVYPNQAKQIPPLHEAVLRCTAGRPHATTEEFGHLTGKAPQTIRKNYSQSGTCFGIRPLKLGNRLLWPTDAITRLLEGGLAA
jgi:hypothetical protein